MGSGFGGFVRGAAAVAVPMILEEEKEKQLAARDARLAKLQTERDKQVQGAQSAENKLERDARSKESGLDRDQEQDNADRAFEAMQSNADRSHEVDVSRLELDKLSKANQDKVLEMQKSSLALEIDKGTYDQKQRNELESLFKQYETETDPAKSGVILRSINMRMGKSLRDLFSVDMGTEVDPASGMVIQKPDVVMDRNTGQRFDINPLLQQSSGGTPGQYNTPDDLLKAFNAGQVTKEEAEKIWKEKGWGK